MITPDSQSKRVGQQIESGSQMLNPNMAEGNFITRKPKEPPCDDAFIDNACGPRSSIQLAMLPGIYGNVMQSTGRGGMIGQLGSTLIGFGAVGIEQFMQQYQDALEEMKHFDGAGVSIIIPLIDYGFSGTFHNAALKVSKKGGGEYEAIGPSDIQPGPGYRFPLAGKVTIEEYTPTLLRGSFSGQLVDMSHATLQGDDPVLPIHNNIEGRFQIVTPSFNDKRTSLSTTENPAEAAIKDLKELFPQLDQATLENLRKAQNPFGKSSAGSASAHGGGGVCDCSCNVVNQAQGDCVAHCSATFTACEGIVATSVERPDRPLRPSALEAVEGERYLEKIPNACDFLDESVATTVLRTAKVRLVADGTPSGNVSSTCNYNQVDSAKIWVGLDMVFRWHILIDSRNDSIEELQAKVFRGVAMDAPVEHVQGLERFAFVYHKGAMTNLRVITGILGLSSGGEFSSELVSTYWLNDASRSPEQRLSDLLQLATPQTIKLRKLSAKRDEPGTGDP